MQTTLITPTYAPDGARVRLLCRTLDELTVGWDEHWLVIDRRDRDVFSDLAGPRRRLVFKEDVLPAWLHPPLIGRRWWLSSRSLPVRGWIVQQLVKLSMAEVGVSGALVFADSDVAFIRPFDFSGLADSSGRLRLFAGPRSVEAQADRRHRTWYRVAKELFAVTDPEYATHEYISQLVTWRVDVLQAMTRALSEATGCDWRVALARRLDFSEYILYGVFSEYALGAERAGHRLEGHELCYCSWHHRVRDAGQVRAFVESVPAAYSAALIQSNLGIAPSEYEQLILAALDRTA